MDSDNVIKSDNHFPVVGIGASAGGLDAFKKLLKAIPTDSGIAYVLVQHLDPSHESLLPELLQKVTHIPVLEIADDVMVKPDHIYVIPSNKMLVANDGILKLTPRPDASKKKQNLPIDLFFRSLAEVHQSYAIGVVLSGTASDGTNGLKSIKDFGGLTFAQDSESATFKSMPESAVKAGVVDFVLPPEKIPEKILEITRRINGGYGQDEHLQEQDDDVIKKIISLLRIRKGTDFTYYKQTTIHRRLYRRMTLCKMEKPADYLKFLKEHGSELDVLYQDFLIPVTAFFRDEMVFAHLCETIFPQIIKNKADDGTIRIWVAGCSTGEEAYSIAICLKEILGGKPAEIQLFATDLSEPAIEKARIGIYSPGELENVSAQRLSEYFTKTNRGYKVNKSIRDMCIFAVHNFLKNPPFGKMDLISCRNVLIYMEPYLQKKALTTFHYSLNPKGYLWLGKSDSISSVPDLFVPNRKNDKIFVRKDKPGKFIEMTSQLSEQTMNSKDTDHRKKQIHDGFLKAAEDVLLNKYTPAGVIVNETMDIVHFRGNTTNYLEQLPGKPSHNLFKLAKQGLGFELRSILHKTKKELHGGNMQNQTVRKENIPLQLSDGLHSITIEAIPLQDTIDPYYLILFHDFHSSIQKKAPAGKSKPDDKDARILQLEKELSMKEMNMLSITEELEATNEELQSDNEELLSSSEELQSLNEELETSQEELQSTNEELLAVNQEIISLNEQITEARDFSEAIVSTIHEPMIILDKDLRVKSANKSFYNSFLVTEEETKGVLLYDLGNHQWNIPGLRKLLKEILTKDNEFHDFEITHHFPGIGKKIMLLNARRLLQESQDEQLILLAIHDVTEIRKKIYDLQKIEKELLKKDIIENRLEKEGLEKAVEERTKELKLVNRELVIQYVEKEKRAEELIIANKELAFQNEEKEKRANELIIANKELAFQIEEKVKRAEELIIANEELAFQNEDKEKITSELLLANKELSSFTYIASHDLQEPLRKIQIYISRIEDNKEQKLDEKNKEYFKRIQVASSRMQTLINDLLSYSRISESREEFTSIDLNNIIHNVLQELTLMQTIEATNTTLNLGQLPKIQGIAFQLEQLFTNLIINSIKYSDSNRAPVINIESILINGADVPLETADDTIKYAKITVSDNGIGFEQQYAEKIFQLFQRLHDKQTYSGTGIGLTISKKIVDNHKGFITVSSVPDVGTTISIYLPADE